MKQGYGIFGKAFRVMLENDVHDVCSIDHQFMREAVLLEDESRDFLYSNVRYYDMTGHELYGFAQQFVGHTQRETLGNILAFTSDIAAKYNVDFKDMFFGGTEKQILDRGTDWCADMARLGAVLAQCCGIPCRIVHLVNLSKAYHGHVVCEAYYEGSYGVVDFLMGYQFYEDKPISAYELLTNKAPLKDCPEEYQGYFTAIAINEYDPTDPNNDYTISVPNPYTLQLIYSDHSGQWIMGEDQ